MLLASRIWVSMIGLLSILSVIPHWFRIEGLAVERGVQAMGLIGRANVRADMGGIFLAIGALALIASYRRSPTWLLATMILPACALLGRIVSLWLDSFERRLGPPMIVEAAVIVALGVAYHIWNRAPPSQF
jgi:hypothetical protein